MPDSRKRALLEVAGLFLKLGFTAFGGPAAHVAYMEDEIVRRRRWLTHQEFLDLLGAANLIPGPNSTEMAIHVGRMRAGWPGLVTGGLCFLLPAALISGVLAWAYVRWHALPHAAGLLYGVKPVIIAIIVHALWRLARSAVKNGWLAALAVAAIVLSALDVNEIAVLLGGGLVAALVAAVPRRGTVPAAALSPLAALGLAAPATAVPFGLGALFLFFAKVGAVLFGSGYVLIAFLRADLVERWHWLSESQLLDAVAVGQVTPGPLFTTATFIGYVLGAAPGAAVATAGIFLPAFVYVALSSPLIPRLRSSPVAGAFLDGVNASAIALMVVVAWQLGRAALVDWTTVALALAAAAVLLRWRVNSIWLVLAGAVVGWFSGAGT